MKKFLALMLSVCIIFSGMTGMVFTASAQDTITVLAGSDFQNSNGNDAGKKVVEGIVDAIIADGVTKADGFLACGDYDVDTLASGNADTAAGVTAMKEAVSDLVSENMIFIQGNHDRAIGEDGIAESGDNDPANGAYGVFVMNEDDYPWYGGTRTGVKKTAQNLIDYLNQKLATKYDKPIFVLSHLPLHYNMRAKQDGDGIYGKYIFDVLNTAAAKGLNIIFMFGHNHAQGYDDYIGGAAVSLQKGDPILVAAYSKDAFTQETLNFSYMNAGYTGYYRDVNDGADVTLTMSIFEISEDTVTITRYDKNGVHNLKSAGVRNAYKDETDYDPNTTVYTSPYTLTLTKVTDSTPIPTLIGTAEKPIEISTSDELEALKGADTYGSYYKLTKDITLDADYEAFEFSACLDGDGHTINLGDNYTQPGLFTALSDEFDISNLKLKGTINGGSNDSGAIAGDIPKGANGKLTNITNHVNVTSTAFSGGLVGDMQGVVTVSGCINHGAINGYTSAAGIFGRIGGSAASATITNCANLGSITNTAATGYMGGIVGWSRNDISFSNCYNAMNIIGNSNDTCGGILAHHNTGTVTISNCYNDGTVTANKGYGGILGNGTANLTSCYTTSDALTNASNSGTVTFSNCYLVSTTASTLTGVTAVATADALKDKAVVTALGSAYTIKENPKSWEYALPYLVSNPHYAVEPAKGSKENPYQINNQAALEAIADDPDAYYVLTDHIVLDSTYEAFEFKGHLDGDGHTIDLGDSCTQPGLFTVLSNQFDISNLTLRGTLNGGSSNSGALAGDIPSGANGKLTNITNHVSVTSTAYSGGLVGDVMGVVVVSDCINHGAIKGGTIAAGMFGRIAGKYASVTFANCANLGSITNTSTGYMGGIVGWSRNDISFSNCYNAVDIVENSNDICGGILAHHNTGTVTISNCYNDGNIQANGGYGGILGNGTANLTSCYTTSDALTNASNSGTVTFSNCYLVSTTASTLTGVTAVATADALKDKAVVTALGSAYTIKENPKSGEYTLPYLVSNPHYVAEQAQAPQLVVVPTAWITETPAGMIVFAKIGAGVRTTVVDYGVAYAKTEETLNTWDGTQTVNGVQLLSAKDIKTNVTGFGIWLKELPVGTYYTKPYVTYKTESGTQVTVPGTIVTGTIDE